MVPVISPGMMNHTVARLEDPRKCWALGTFTAPPFVILWAPAGGATNGYHSSCTAVVHIHIFNQGVVQDPLRKWLCRNPGMGYLQKCPRLSVPARSHGPCQGGNLIFLVHPQNISNQETVQFGHLHQWLLINLDLETRNVQEWGHKFKCFLAGSKLVNLAITCYYHIKQRNQMAHISQWDNHPYIKDLPHNLERLGGPSEVQSNFKFCGMIAIACHSYTPWKDTRPKKTRMNWEKQWKFHFKLSFPARMFSPQPPRNDWYILGSTSHGHSPGSPQSRQVVRRSKCNLASISSSCAESSWLRDPYTHKFHTGLKTSDLAQFLWENDPSLEWLQWWI